MPVLKMTASSSSFATVRSTHAICVYAHAYAHVYTHVYTHVNILRAPKVKLGVVEQQRPSDVLLDERVAVLCHIMRREVGGLRV